MCKVTPKMYSPENKGTTRAFCLLVLHGVKPVAVSKFPAVFLRTRGRFSKRRLQHCLHWTFTALLTKTRQAGKAKSGLTALSPFHTLPAGVCFGAGQFPQP